MSTNTVLAALPQPHAKILPLVPNKRPRPYMRSVDPTDIAWEPKPLPLYTTVGGETVRAGEAFAIVREGLERWPLGS